MEKNPIMQTRVLKYLKSSSYVAQKNRVYSISFHFCRNTKEKQKRMYQEDASAMIALFIPIQWIRRTYLMLTDHFRANKTPNSHYNNKIALLLLFTFWEFFTSALADGLSLEFEWQQVSSSLEDSLQDSGRSQQCCSLDGPHSSSNFQVFQSL